MLVVIAGISLALLPESYRSKIGEIFGSSAANSEIDLSGVVTEVVKKGPFKITITERGELDSMSNASLASSVRGTTKIISIVPEGTIVKKGDTVCELDSSSLVDKRQEQEIKLTNAVADLEKSKGSVEIQITQNESDLAKATLELKLAELDLKKYELGESKLEKNELNSTITIAQEKLTQATENYNFAKRVAKKGYKTPAEVEILRITVNDERLKLEIAKEKLKVMEDYTYDRTMLELKENFEEAGREIVRVKRSGLTTLAQFKAELKANKLTIQVKEAELNKLKEQITACTLLAPQDGEVVYSRENRRRRESEVIAAGTSVWERQVILNIPDLTKMKVDTFIHESRISVLKKGLPVFIKISSAPDVIFNGVVDSVSSVPTSANWYQPHLKEYQTVIRLTDSGEKLKKLRPGLSAEIEIIVSERENILQIPVQAIIGVGDKNFAYVIDGSEFKRRDLVLGTSNNKSVEILDGLEEGQVVVLNPRTTFSDEITEIEQEFISKKKKDDSSKKISKGVKLLKGNKKSNPKNKKKNKGKSDKNSNKAKKKDPAAMFKKMDADGDGLLSGSEIPAKMKKIISKLDKNSDGKIDQSEWNKAAKMMQAK